MIKATIEHTLTELSARNDLSVAERNLMRDCEIALGMTDAKPQTVAAAWKRCKRVVLNDIRG
jgi:hypothetical protein